MVHASLCPVVEPTADETAGGSAAGKPGSDGRQAWLTRRRLDLPLAASCTVLLAIGAPPGGITWLIWVGFAPLVYVLLRSELSHKRAFLLGWLGGVSSGLYGFPWITEMLITFAELPWVVAFVLYLTSVT